MGCGSWGVGSKHAGGLGCGTPVCIMVAHPTAAAGRHRPAPGRAPGV